MRGVAWPGATLHQWTNIRSGRDWKGSGKSQLPKPKTTSESRVLTALPTLKIVFYLVQGLVNLGIIFFFSYRVGLYPWKMNLFCFLIIHLPCSNLWYFIVFFYFACAKLHFAFSQTAKVLLTNCCEVRSAGLAVRIIDQIFGALVH